MCLSRGVVEGAGVEWVRGLFLGFTNPVGTVIIWDDVCVWTEMVWGSGFVYGLARWDAVNSGLFMEIADQGISILCSADTYES